MNYIVPYAFILQHLYPVRPQIRKLYGCYALYYQKRLTFFLRDKQTHPEFNGVFVATQPQFFDELEEALHTSHMEFDLDGNDFSWIFLSEDLEDFEEKVKAACEMIKNGDERIGH